MPSLTLLLTRLERMDTLPAQTALHHVLDECLADDGAAPQAANAGLALFNGFFRQGAGQQAYAQMVAFCEERLTNWHSLKVNAVKSAWEAAPDLPADPEARKRTAQAMRDRVLINLRQGLTEDPVLLADAHFLQALAQANQPLAFGQAIKDLRAEGLPLPADNEALRGHCLIVLNAFKFLIG